MADDEFNPTSTQISAVSISYSDFKKITDTDVFRLPIRCSVSSSDPEENTIEEYYSNLGMSTM